MTVLTVPADLKARAGELVGRPFLAKGDTPDGWDCRGLARWCLRAFCGVETPDYQERYAAVVITPCGAGDRQRLLQAGLQEQWRPVAPQAGAVAWLEWMGRAAHVGFMLSEHELIHADNRCGTALMDLRAPAAGYRLRGAFVPAFVTDIIHL